MSEFSQYISPPEEIIEDTRNGKMIVLVDAEDRENEGDLIIPAQMATPDAINFMAIKLIASGVAICAGIIKSPSFSRSSASTNTIILPLRVSSIISSGGEIYWLNSLIMCLQVLLLLV